MDVRRLRQTLNDSGVPRESKQPYELISPSGLAITTT